MNEKIPGRIENKKEFLFQEGVKDVVDKANKLLSEKDCVVISISGGVGDKSFNDSDVGKSTLSGELCRNLGTLEVVTFGVSNIDELRHRDDIIYVLKQSGHSKFVIVLGSESVLSIPNDDLEKFRNYKNYELQKAGDTIGLSLDKIDMNVLIYRPDRPIGENERQNADIVIRNEQARDKERG